MCYVQHVFCVVIIYVFSGTKFGEEVEVEEAFQNATETQDLVVA